MPRPSQLIPTPGSTHQRGRHGHDRATHHASGGSDDPSFSAFSSASATTLLPGQDKPAPSGPISAAPYFVVSCGVWLFEIRLSEIRKPQVRYVTIFVTGLGWKGKEGTGMYGLNGTRQDLDIAN